jgi:hypothetical protein
VRKREEERERERERESVCVLYNLYSINFQLVSYNITWMASWSHECTWTHRGYVCTGLNDVQLQNSCSALANRNKTVDSPLERKHRECVLLLSTIFTLCSREPRNSQEARMRSDAHTFTRMDPNFHAIVTNPVLAVALAPCMLTRIL